MFVVYATLTVFVNNWIVLSCLVVLPRQLKETAERVDFKLKREYRQCKQYLGTINKLNYLALEYGIVVDRPVALLTSCQIIIKAWYVRIYCDANGIIVHGGGKSALRWRLEGSTIRKLRNIACLNKTWNAFLEFLLLFPLTSLFITALARVANSLSDPRIDWYTANLKQWHLNVNVWPTQIRTDLICCVSEPLSAIYAYFLA